MASDNGDRKSRAVTAVTADHADNSRSSIFFPLRCRGGDSHGQAREHFWLFFEREIVRTMAEKGLPKGERKKKEEFSPEKL